MRQFLYNLATRLKAPLWVRAHLAPSVEMMLISSATNPVREFYNELGMSKSYSHAPVIDGLKQVIVAAHENVYNIREGEYANYNDRAFLYAAGVSVLTMFTLFGAMTIPTVPVSAAFVGLVFLVSIPVALVIGLARYLMSDDSDYQPGFFFYALLMEMVGVSFSPGVRFSWLPAVLLLVVWLGGGIHTTIKYWTPKTKKTAEQLVSEAFDRFLAKNRPDVVDSDSVLNKKLNALAERIIRGREVLAKFKGELIAEQGRKGTRIEAIQTSVEQIASRVTELEEQQKLLQADKAELLSALQVFDSIKNDARGYVRLQDLSREAEEVLGQGSVLALQAGSELESIRLRIRQGMERINRAVEHLGLKTLPGVEDGADVKVLFTGAEQIGERTAEHERSNLLLRA